MKSFNGHWGIFCLWLVLFWPLAIVYWAVKVEEIKKGHRDY